MSSKPTTQLELKDFAIVVPLLGTAISITWDVGFFYGLDINYFTLFSLSEHIVFALEALPLALLAAFGLLIFSIENTESSFAFREEDIANRPSLKLIGMIAASVIWVLGLVATVYFLLLSIFIFITIGCGALVMVTRAPSVLQRAWALSVFGVLAILSVTLALGYDSAQAIRDNPIPVNTILLTDGELSGRVIRMGERGVLFWQTGTRRLKVIRWDLVKEIATIDPPKK